MDYEYIDRRTSDAETAQDNVVTEIAPSARRLGTSVLGHGVYVVSGRRDAMALKAAGYEHATWRCNSFDGEVKIRGWH